MRKGSMQRHLGRGRWPCFTPGGAASDGERRLCYSDAMRTPNAGFKLSELMLVLAILAQPWVAVGQERRATPVAENAVAAPAVAPAPLAVDYRCDGPATLFWLASALSGDPLLEAHPWQLWWAAHPGATRADRDREEAALAIFGRLRATYRGPLRSAKSRSNGWVPVPPPSSQRLDVLFAELFLGARDGTELLKRAEPLLTERDRADLQQLAAVWLPKLASASTEDGDACGFAKSFEVYARQNGLDTFLGKAATLFRAPSGGAVTVQFVRAAGGKSLRGRRVGDYLVVEVRPDQRPQHRGDVVAHEVCHWLQERGGMEDDPDLIDALFATADKRAAQAWELLAEGTATALGQGLWAAIALRSSGGPIGANPGAQVESARAQSPLGEKVPEQRRWYEDDQIDPYAKALAPFLAHALRQGAQLNSLVPEILAAVPPSAGSVAATLRRYVLLSDHRDSPWMAKTWFAQVPPRAVWRADLRDALGWATGAKAASLVVVATWGELGRLERAQMGIAAPPPKWARTSAVFSGERAGGARLLVVVAPTTERLGEAAATVAGGSWPAAGWTLALRPQAKGQ